MKNIDLRIQRLEEQLKQAKQQKRQSEARIKAKEAKRTRQQDTRRKILVGAVILARVERGEWPKENLLRMLDTSLTRPEDRALFDLPEKPQTAVSTPDTKSTA